MNGCHDLMKKAMNFNDVAIVSVSDFYNFLLYLKMSDKFTYYQENRGIILNRAKEYDKNNQERLREQARNKNRELSEKEKDIKREYGRNKYKNMSEKNKQRLKEYQKNYRRAKNKHKKFFFFFSLHGIKWNKKP